MRFLRFNEDNFLIDFLRWARWVFVAVSLWWLIIAAAESTTSSLGWTISALVSALVAIVISLYGFTMQRQKLEDEGQRSNPSYWSPFSDDDE